MKCNKEDIISMAITYALLLVSLIWSAFLVSMLPTWLDFALIATLVWGLSLASTYESYYQVSIAV